MGLTRLAQARRPKPEQAGPQLVAPLLQRVGRCAVTQRCAANDGFRGLTASRDARFSSASNRLDDSMPLFYAATRSVFRSPPTLDFLVDYGFFAMHRVAVRPATAPERGSGVGRAPAVLAGSCARAGLWSAFLPLSSSIRGLRRRAAAGDGTVRVSSHRPPSAVMSCGRVPSEQLVVAQG